MLRRDTMLRPNRLGIAVLLLLAAPLVAQQTQERDPVPSPDDISPGVIAAPKPTTPAAAATPPAGSTSANTPVPAGPDVAQPSGNNTVAVAGAPTKPRSNNGQYTFSSTVNEVRLYATVVDQKQRLVSGLSQNDFHVFEDGAQQQITFFQQEDVPVALGI